jgi:nickel superoxide dismutase
MSTTARILTGLLLLALASSTAWGHCQVPCGIYDDEARLALMLEHVTTIEKGMTQIAALGKEDKPDWNQLVRWIDNKDDHADQLSEIVTYYFMAQRIKPPQAGADDAATKKYATELSLLHRIMVHAMKAKQTTDQQHVKALRQLIGEFKTSYHGHP